MPSSSGGRSWSRSQQEQDVFRRNLASTRSPSPSVNHYQIVISYQKKDICVKNYNGGDGGLVWDLRDALQQLGYAVLPAGPGPASVVEDEGNEGEGPRWATQVAKAIPNCEVVLVICTPGYGESKWSLREVDLADRHQRRIIPVWLSGGYPPPAVEPYVASLPRVPKGPLSLAALMGEVRRGGQGTDPGMHGPGPGPGQGRVAAAAAAYRRPDRAEVLRGVVEEMAALLRRYGCNPRVVRPAGMPYLPAVPKNGSSGSKQSAAGCVSLALGLRSGSGVAGQDSLDRPRCTATDAFTIPPTAAAASAAASADAVATTRSMEEEEEDEGERGAAGTAELLTVTAATAAAAAESSGLPTTAAAAALMKACLAFDLVRIGQLLEGGVSVNVADESGWTALHRAAYRGNVVLVEVLVRAGADVEARTRLGDTPLHVGSRQSNPLIARVLREAGADVNSRGQ
ncbi:hypothetical protein VOLCADRAFT_99597, partial [Volvox carteri f. nagariensis]